MAANNVRKFIKAAVDDVHAAEMESPAMQTVILQHHLNPSRTSDRPVLWKILRGLLFPVGTDFSASTPEDKHLCAVLLQAKISHLLEKFGFSYGDIKLLQAATGTLIQSSSLYGIRSYGTHSQIPWYGMASGLLPNALSPLQNTSHMEYPRYGMGLASILAGLPTSFDTRNSTVAGSMITALLHSDFIPNDIDFYCANGYSDDVTEYLKYIGTLTDETQPLDYDYEDVHGLRCVRWLSNPDGKKVNVVETHSTFPLDTILNFHSAPPRGAIAWNKVSHFEVNGLKRGLALITLSSIRLIRGDLNSHIQAWGILHKYIGRGFQFVFEYDQPHECGRHVDYPATMRTTVDNGCLHVSLPNVPTITHNRPRADPILTWSLNGAICKAGKVNGMDAHYSKDFQHLVFRKMIQAFIKMRTPPENRIEIFPWGDDEYSGESSELSDDGLNDEVSD
ncbi:hypothetical protein B0H13DRAFT_2473665 [Mycena leptocephala]|nr:hypothetical protein B0H13DRAFT_2473665 [Mycena leptocephala]